MNITYRVLRTSALPTVTQTVSGKSMAMAQPAVEHPIQRPSQPSLQAYYQPTNIRFGVGIDPDYERLKEIQRGKLREDLKKYISPNDLDVFEGGKMVKIPRKRIDQPRFMPGKPQENGGVGSGDGEVGDEIQPGQPGDGQAPGQAGSEAGAHENESWVPAISRSEIARLFPDYCLPNLKPKGTENVKQTREVWDTEHRYGQEVLLRQTLLNALKRETAERTGRDPDFDPEDMDLEEVMQNLLPEDMRRRSYRPVEKPQANVRLYFVIDISGSMTDKTKEMARRLNFYIETVIGHQIGMLNAELREETFSDDMWGEGLEVVYVVHDTEAKIVSGKDFYTLKEGGGTRISGAYDLIKKDILKNSPPAEWNNYVFHYSDGDNWGEDNRTALQLVKDLKPLVNEFGFVLTESPYGSGDFARTLTNEFGRKDPIVRIGEIESLEPNQIDNVMKTMLTEREGDGNP